jgi:hypothetical protein
LEDIFESESHFVVIKGTSICRWSLSTEFVLSSFCHGQDLAGAIPHDQGLLCTTYTMKGRDRGECVHSLPHMPQCIPENLTIEETTTKCPTVHL